MARRKLTEALSALCDAKEKLVAANGAELVAREDLSAARDKGREELRAERAKVATLRQDVKAAKEAIEDKLRDEQATDSPPPGIG